jgi:hypothetical protein
VAVRMTPNMRHVQSLQVMGPRLAGGVPTEVPDQFKFAERFPLIAIGATYGGIFGIGIVLLVLPLGSSLLAVHFLAVVGGMAIAAVGARFLTQWYQKRLQGRLGSSACDVGQALDAGLGEVPGGRRGDCEHAGEPKVECARVNGSSQGAPCPDRALQGPCRLRHAFSLHGSPKGRLKAA